MMWLLMMVQRYIIIVRRQRVVVFFCETGGVEGTNRTYLHTKNKESTLYWVPSLSVCVCLRMQESFDFDVSLNFLHVFL